VEKAALVKQMVALFTSRATDVVGILGPAPLFSQ
jgi:hypothetical protein